MTKTACESFREELPELVAQTGGSGLPGEPAHVRQCEACLREWNEMRSTWALLDEWVAPEPSAYFDTRLYARLREAQTAAPEGLWERLTAFLRFSTGRQFRPAVAAVLAFVLLLGGTAATFLTHHGTAASASPTVNDLKIYDNNAQALQEMDLLDDGGADQAPAAAPQT